MRITLYNLEIENFKGIKKFGLCIDGENVTISAENGVGKTTIYDSFLWLLFGKDSTGRKDFEVRPLDRRNKPVKGVVVVVQAELDIDGTRHSFRKENHEKVVKGQLRGYETLCWVDEVPKKVGEYADYIADIISEDNFKLLTDLNFFNSKMHWTDRRKVLLDIAGEIEQPEGFDELLGNLKGRSLDEYKKVLSEQKKRHTKERDEINPRIDEILKGLEHPAEDNKELEKQRKGLKTEIDKLNTERQEIHNQEIERQKINTKIANLTLLRTKREGALAADTSGVQKLLDEKAQITKEVAEAEQLEQTAESSLKLAEDKLIQVGKQRDNIMWVLNNLREEKKSVETEPSADICYACKQKLPSDIIEKVKAERQERLDEIDENAKTTQKKINEQTKQIKSLTKNVDLLKEQYEKTKLDLQDLRKNANIRLTAIDLGIKNRPTIPPEQDEVWCKMTAEIKELEKTLGPPVNEQLEEIESKQTAIRTAIDNINESLAQADRMVKDKARIKELETKEKELAQALANIEKQLADIEQYKAMQSTMITAAVNNLFEVTEFKMFKELLNGGLEECCEVTYKGVPYGDMSTGEGIYVGLDINNVLSGHYGYSVPLFIDHSESLSLPIKSKSQIIQLRMKSGVKQLTIEKEKSTRKAVA